MIYFTADWHLDHANILRYCHRPFHSAQEMNGVILANTLATVRPTDTLYVLGDFAFRAETWLACDASLSSACEVVHIHGNHDPKKFSHPLALSLKWNKRRYYLCHYPWQTWRPNTVMIHGHCHGNRITLPEDSRQRMRYDVGVDTVWGGRRYYPVSIEQIERRIDRDTSNHQTEGP